MISTTISHNSRVATLPQAAVDAGHTGPLGGGLSIGGRSVDMNKLMLYAAVGALAGIMVPIVPGGPLGGAAIGAAIAVLL